MDSPLISLNEAAALLRVSPRWLRDRAVEYGGTRAFGRLKFFRQVILDRLQEAERECLQIKQYRSKESHPQWKGGRTVSNGYYMIMMPEHPRANPKGYVFEHLVIAEKALGKPLPEKAQMHHVNGDKLDNRTCNLVICQDQAYHKLIHARMRAYAATGDPHQRQCYLCKKHDLLSNLWTDGSAYRHVECCREYDMAKRLKRKSSH